MQYFLKNLINKYLNLIKNIKNMIKHDITREKVNGIFNALKCTFKFVKTHLNVRFNALIQLK